MSIDEFFRKEVEQEKESILEYDSKNHVITFKSEYLAEKFILKHFDAAPKNLNIILPQDGKIYVVEED